MTRIFIGPLTLLSVLTLGAPAHADPRRTEPPSSRSVRVPELIDTRATESQKAWMKVKGLAPRQQAVAIASRKLSAMRCTDLVDARELSAKGKLDSFDFRDNVRGRGWGRPTLMLLLSEAMKRFSAEMRKEGLKVDGLITIGDISQPGCGQLAHGVLVQEVSGKAGDELLAKAEPVDGELLVRDILRASDFPWEADRFGPPAERVLVLTRILGVREEGPSKLVRVAKSRHRELSAPSPEDVGAFAKEVAALASEPAASVEKTSRRIARKDGAGAVEAVWVSHHIAPQKKRQVVLVTRKKPGRRIDWGDIVEVRLANWQDKKPGSFPEEVRWEAQPRTEVTVSTVDAKTKRPPKATPVPPTRVEWVRWQLLNEAGHISHISGVDADLSYVTRGNVRHFAVDLPMMDAPRTFRWFEILDETARELGTPVETILIDPKVRQHLRANLPMKGRDGKQKSRVWKLLALSGGHDAHHHVRIVEASPAKEKAALKALGLD
jgi:murein endopeptidase